MADAQWYYAQDDQQHGPTSQAELAALLASGKLDADALVWCDQMDDWTPAADVAQLVDGSSTAAPPAPEPPPAPPQIASVGRQPASPAHAASGGVSPLLAPLEFVVPLAQPLVLVGICAMLICRGCDQLDQRAPARLQAKLQLEQSRFLDRKEAELERLQQRRTQIEQDESLDENAQLRALGEVANQAQEMEDSLAEQESELRSGRWLRLQQAGRDAQAQAAVSSWWRAWVRLLAALAASVGLLALGFCRTGPQRWTAVVLLAIIVLGIVLPGLG